MGFFDELQGKLVKGSKAVAVKGKEVADITKLKVQISAEERKLDETYAKIGKAFYEANPGSQTYAEEFEQISTSLKTIAECKAEISKRKGVAVCSECGAENPVGASFCNVCGAKYEKVDDVKEADIDEMFEETDEAVSESVDSEE